MEFYPPAGNTGLVQRLKAQAAGRGLSHAYLICGPSGSGKRTLARWMAAAMVCRSLEGKPCLQCPDCKKVMAGVHPDVTVLGQDKAIAVAAVRQLRADAYIRPNEASRKVYILCGAQDMNPQSQNALLKVLEEGPAYAAFLLLSHNPDGVLATIRSRCEGLSLAPLDPEQTEAVLRARFPQLPTEQVRAAAQRCGGILGRAVTELEDSQTGEPVRQAALRLLEFAAGGEELALAQWCIGLEKWERGDLAQLFAQATALLRDALALQAGGRPLFISSQDAGTLKKAARQSREALMRQIALLEKLRNHTAANGNRGILCGALAAGLNGGQYDGNHLGTL